MKPIVAALLLGPLAVASAAAQEAPRLALPIDCRPGVDCWIAKLMDHDRGARDVDWRCGPRAPGNHEGTDFAVADLARAAATRVLAAAPGVVLGVRNDMADVNVLTIGPAAIKGRDCGNGLVLDHGGGWHTQYCHLKQGSVTVRPGQRVEQGAELGRVGLSGMTELPHLHLTVRKDGKNIDPFTGTGQDGACGGAAAPLWRDEALAALPYEARRLYLAGFAPGSADRIAARAGDYGGALAADAPALVLWADALAPRVGDVVRLVITAPDGREIFRHEIKMEKDHAQWFGFAGTKRQQTRWPAGRYHGRVELLPAEGGAPLVRDVTGEIR